MPGYRRKNVNLRTHLERIIRRAGLEPWPRFFQNLRASRESELAAAYPLHVATTWIGNTARIAERHYLQVPPEYFQQAVRNPADPAPDGAAQNSAQCQPELSSKGRKGTTDNGLENADLLVVTSAYRCVQNHPLETGGIEPPSARCDRAVIPLHHVPVSWNLDCTEIRSKHKGVLKKLFLDAGLTLAYSRALFPGD